MCICSWSVDEDTVLLFHWNLNIRCVCFGQILKRASSGSSTKWPTAPESRSTRRVSSSGHWWMDWLIDRCVGCSLMVCVCVCVDAGTVLFYQPGLLYGGSVEHECNVQRSVGYYLEALLMLARSWRRRSEPCWRVSPTTPQTHRWVSALIFDLSPLVLICHFKGIVHPKWICHHLLTLTLFQTCMSIFILLRTKEDVLKNVCNQTGDGSHWLPK